ARRADPAGGRTGQAARRPPSGGRSEEHTSELQSHLNLVCRLLLEKKKGKNNIAIVDAATMQLRNFTLALAVERPQRMEITSDGNSWHGVYVGDVLGRDNLQNGQAE